MRLFNTVSVALIVVALSAPKAALAEGKFQAASNDPAKQQQMQEMMDEKEKSVEEFNNEHSDEKEAAYIKFETMSSEEFIKEETGAKLPPGERQIRSFGLVIPENPADRYDEESERFLAWKRAMRTSLPSSFDARDYNWVGPVKDQKSCGSCAAFSAVSTIETCFAKATGQPAVDLSEQYMVDCAYDGDGANACNGAWPHAYHAYAADVAKEIAHEYSYPYLNTAPKLTCPKEVDKHHTGATVTGKVFTYKCTELDLKNMVYEFGSATSAVYASDPKFEGYKSGTATCSPDSTTINHAITVVGWNDAEKYWIIKNSWGTWWGDNGYIKLAYGSCGIASVCAAVQCEASGTAETEPTTTQAPAVEKSTCDVSAIYGNRLTGSYYLTTTINGVDYKSMVTCTNSVCKPYMEVEEKNCCKYICGRDPCKF